MRPTGRSVRVGVLALAVALLSGCLQLDVEVLSSDDLQGRDNATPGSASARELVLGYLRQWAEGPVPGATGDEAYLQHFDGGTNVLAVIPGTELPDEYVVVGAHYDGLGTSCRRATAEDSICNGATDNATGTALALAMARRLHYGPKARRSVVIALWDREEDSLAGSRAFAVDPVIPFDDIVAYVNFDIQGANLRPSGRDVTFAVGAETGGPVLVDTVRRAADDSQLDTRLLSLIFGQGRSDHATFAANQVPSVFFTDSTGPCYHTVDDEVDVVDFGKLREQSLTGERVVRALADQDATPTFDPAAPLATYDDALSVQSLVHRLVTDRDTFSDADWATLLDRVATIDAAVAAGPGAFADHMVPMLLATADVVGLLDNADCDGYLPTPG